MNPTSASLAESLQNRFPELGSAGLQPHPDRLEIVGPDQVAVITIREEYEEWVVETLEGHAHVASSEEALDMAANLLLGNARFTEEFRGETLSATWLENRVEDYFETTGKTAFFLSPFEADEWLLWPGERWKQIRTTRKLNRETGAIEETKAERFSDECAAQVGTSLTWMEFGLGSPVVGLRWSVGEGNRFVFQAPVGWRRRSMGEVGQKYLDYQPQDEGLLFRARNYYREEDEPLNEVRSHGVGPHAVEHQRLESDGQWIQHTWTLLFTDGTLRMMGIVDFFYVLEKEAEMASLLERLHAAAPQALFVPLEWDFTREE